MIKYLELRKKNYLDRKTGHQKSIFDIDTWKENPYSCFKARVYIELSTFFAFFLQFTSLTPNNISLIYCASGIIAGLFLASNNFTLMIVGLAIFVLKGAIDWTDGLIARMKNQISSVGHILDTWGSHIGTISLISSIGVYCFNNTNNIAYLFLTIFILFLRLIDFKFFAYYQSFQEILSKKKNFNLKDETEKSDLVKNENFFIKFIKSFMDDRSRSVDLICFLIFLEIIYKINYFSYIIFGLYLLRTIIFTLGTFYSYYLKQKFQNQIK